MNKKFNSPDEIIEFISSNDRNSLRDICIFLKENRIAEMSRIAISEISFVSDKCSELCRIVKDFSRGEEWDDQDIVRIPAIFALSRVCELDDDVKEILKVLIKDQNPVVRDAACVEIQIFSGVNREDVLWGSGDGALQHKIDLSLIYNTN